MTDAYAAAGVVYDALDYVKRMGQQGAARTKVSDRLRRLGIGFVEESRGESAVLFEFPEFFLAHVQEGLGTKNRVADHYAIASATTGKTGRTYYDSLARCNSAMVMNDIITCGAEPLSLGIEWAAGSSDWFTQDRVNDLVRGTEHSANETGCVWGPGETPVLKEVINPATLSMSGSGVGIIQPKSRRITGSKLRDADVMIGFSSSGVHANGLTLARQIGDELEHGYLTEMPSGQTYGDALLTPTQNYARLMQALLAAGIDIHYAVNVTGHGFRKLMRAKTLTPFTYNVSYLPPTSEIFSFMQEKGGLSDRDMFGNYNMDVGFVVMVSKSDEQRAMPVAADLYDMFDPSRIDSFHLGEVYESDKKQVCIPEKNLVFGAETLNI